MCRKAFVMQLIVTSVIIEFIFITAKRNVITVVRYSGTFCTQHWSVATASVNMCCDGTCQHAVSQFNSFSTRADLSSVLLMLSVCQQSCWCPLSSVETKLYIHTYIYTHEHTLPEPFSPFDLSSLGPPCLSGH